MAKEKKAETYYSLIDFADFEETEDPNDIIIVNLGLPNQIKHSFPIIDRCCKFHGRKIAFDNIDNMERISCDISKDDFKRNYADKRRSVLLLGCQEGWQARNWTFGNLLSRYSSKWPLSWYHSQEENCYSGHLDGPTIFHMMNQKIHIKSMIQLSKSLKESITNQRYSKNLHTVLQI